MPTITMRVRKQLKNLNNEIETYVKHGQGLPYNCGCELAGNAPQEKDRSEPVQKTNAASLNKQ